MRRSWQQSYLTELVCLMAMTAMIAGLAAAVMASATVGRLDLAAVGTVHASSAEPFTDWMLALTALGATHSILLITALALAALAAARQWRGALTLALSVATTEMVVALAKNLVSRPRPPAEDAVAHAQGFSFPSGHAAAAMAVYGVLVLLAARSFNGAARTLVALAGALVVLGVGVSRVYLGVHYPTDVMAGWLTGGTLALASWLAVTRLRALRLALVSH